MTRHPAPHRAHPERRGPRWSSRLLVASVLVAASFLGGSMAMAADSFSDVPDTHPFRDQVGWLAEAGISTGYGDGTFRPGATVTRQGMAAFMQRLHGARNDLAVASDPGFQFIGSDEWSDVSGASAKVTVPPGASATVLASITAETTCYSGPPGGACYGRLLLDGVEMTPKGGAPHAIASTDDATNTSNHDEGHRLVRYVEGVGPGEHTVTFQARTDSLGTSGSVADWVLTAETSLRR